MKNAGKKRKTKPDPKVGKQAVTEGPGFITIDADTWAASGGTAGMYGRAWAKGRVKIED